MITLEQKQAVNDWVSDCGASFEDAFVSMAIMSNVFGLSGNTCSFARDVQDYIDELVDTGTLKSSGGWCGTVYWRAG